MSTVRSNMTEMYKQQNTSEISILIQLADISIDISRTSPYPLRPELQSITGLYLNAPAGLAAQQHHRQPRYPTFIQYGSAIIKLTIRFITTNKIQTFTLLKSLKRLIIRFFFRTDGIVNVSRQRKTDSYCIV